MGIFYNAGVQLAGNNLSRVAAEKDALKGGCIKRLNDNTYGRMSEWHPGVLSTALWRCLLKIQYLTQLLHQNRSSRTHGAWLIIRSTWQTQEEGNVSK